MVDVTYAERREDRSTQVSLRAPRGRAEPRFGDGYDLGGTVALVNPKPTNGSMEPPGTFLASESLLEVEAALRAQHRGAARRGRLAERGTSAFELGCVLRAQGRVVSALRILREALAVAVLLEPRTVGYEVACLAELAHAAALVGNVEMAQTMLADVPVARIGPSGPEKHHVILAQVWVAAARGEVSSATAAALEWADRAGSVAPDAYRVAALHEVARLGSPRRVVAGFDELDERSAPPVSPTYAEHIRALCARDGAELLAASRSFEVRGMLLFAAEAAAEAFVAYRRDGRRGSALSASGRARELAGLCEGARTPALSLLDLDLRLTPREREVATLAAHGLSNTEIAGRLVASVRTIDNHLHRAYEKLGIHGRAELPALVL
jgi:DNA-binding NarL/FixJ family response regulator